VRDRVVAAWVEAADELAIRFVASTEGDIVGVLPDFGGPEGTAVGLIGVTPTAEAIGNRYFSAVNPKSYAQFDRDLWRDAQRLGMERPCR
jgi:hypothetical protein